jgi:hypothetical protein
MLAQRIRTFSEVSAPAKTRFRAQLSEIYVAWNLGPSCYHDAPGLVGRAWRAFPAAINGRAILGVINASSGNGHRSTLSVISKVEGDLGSDGEF